MERVRQGLEKARGNWPKISRDTGVDYFTICRIARGETGNPRIQTVEAIQGWLGKNPCKRAK